MAERYTPARRRSSTAVLKPQGRLMTDPVSRIRSLTALATLARGEHETATVRAPFTGETLAELPLAGPADLDHAVGIARAAQAEWQSVAVKRRSDVIRRFRGMLLDRSDEILDILQLETGKARGHAFEELVDVALVAAYYCRAAPGLLAPRRRRGAVPLLTRTAELRHPRGVVGVIAPWNYPLVLAVSDSLPALLAGNSVIVKPDIQTTHTALAALELLLEAGLPSGVFQVLPGDGPVAGGGLVDRVDYVSFTGSTATGRLVAQKAAARLIEYSLELGGKNPMIVRADADLERAVAGAVRGSFSNAGQLCIATERIYVHRSVFEPFLESFAARTRQLKLGAGLDFEADVGCMTYGHQLRKVEDHVQDAVTHGAIVHAGGYPRPDIGPLFYEPTVLTGVTPEMKLYADETFGPVVAVAPFDSDEAAIGLANATCYGLNASVWTRDKRAGLSMAGRIEAGVVNVNEAHAATWGSVDATLGGRKASGSGHRHGAEGLLKFTESQTVAIQRGRPLELPAAWLRGSRARSAVIAILRRFKPGSSGR